MPDAIDTVRGYIGPDVAHPGNILFSTRSATYTLTPPQAIATAILDTLDGATR